MIRIVGGTLSGRRLRAPKGSTTRPTSERTREGIASALDSRDAVADARVLDLYAGSGALGFEMLSRGAASVLFVERDAQVARLLRDNAADLGVSDRVEVLCDDVTRPRAQRAIEARAPFSLVLADPPYRDAQAAVDAIAQLGALGVLASGARLLLEHGAKGPPVLPHQFQVISTYRYGDTAVALFVVSASEAVSAEGEGGEDR